MLTLPEGRAHDAPCCSQYLVVGALAMANDSFAQSSGSEAVHSSLSAGVMTELRRSVAAADTSEPTAFKTRHVSQVEGSLPEHSPFTEMSFPPLSSRKEM